MPRQNLCPDPACGAAATGWSASTSGASTARVTGLAGFTRATGYRTTITSTGYASVQPPNVAASPGQVWAAQVQASCSVARSLSVYLNFFNSAGNFLTPNPVLTGAVGPTPLLFSFIGVVAPAGTVTMGVTVESPNAARNDVIVVTCCDLEQVAAAGATIPGYADGDSLGWRWAGAAESSTSAEVLVPGQYAAPRIASPIPLMRAATF